MKDVIIIQKKGKIIIANTKTEQKRDIRKIQEYARLGTILFVSLLFGIAIFGAKIQTFLLWLSAVSFGWMTGYWLTRKEN